MINIYELTCNTLSLLGYPCKEQGTYGPNESLPDTFTTYQIVDDPNNTYANNKPTSTTHRVQTVLYSRDPVIVQGADAALKGVMLPLKFMRAGGRPLPFSQKTGHYAYTSDYRFYNMEG